MASQSGRDRGVPTRVLYQGFTFSANRDTVTRMRWLCVFAACAAFAFAQLPAPNPMGVTPGHLHFVVPDADVMTKAWVDQFGAVPVKSGTLTPLKIPGIYIIVSGARGGRGGEPPAAKALGTRGSVVDHVGFEVRDWDAFKAKAQAANMPWQEVTAGTQAFLTMPDDVTVEIMGNKDLKAPVQFHHIHMAVADAKTAAEAQAWYMKEFGAGSGSRRNLPSAMFTVGEVDFLPARGGAAMPPAPTKGRALDHIGFDVADEDAIFKKFADDGVMVNMAARDMTQQIGLRIGFVTDPYGTYIEVTQGLKNLNDK
jgi:catechol 2,3-dioxygenase-like lactoylglutathione lyase family enzyme